MDRAAGPPQDSPMDLGPAQTYDFKRGTGAVLLIACGALGREIIELIELNGWRHFDVACLPAKLHNTPDLIPEAVRAKIRAARPRLLAFNGKRAAARVLGSEVRHGLQERRFGPTMLFALPSTAGLASRWWDPAPWHELANCRG